MISGSLCGIRLVIGGGGTRKIFKGLDLATAEPVKFLEVQIDLSKM
jgi:hypothetical protein